MFSRRCDLPCFSMIFNWQIFFLSISAISCQSYMTLLLETSPLQENSVDAWCALVISYLPLSTYLLWSEILCKTESQPQNTKDFLIQWFEWCRCHAELFSWQFKHFSWMPSCPPPRQHQFLPLRPETRQFLLSEWVDSLSAQLGYTVPFTSVYHYVGTRWKIQNQKQNENTD